jgi:preprotein translocase subunit SecG
VVVLVVVVVVCVVLLQRADEVKLPLFFSLVVQEVAFGGELGATIRSRSVAYRAKGGTRSTRRVWLRES